MNTPVPPATAAAIADACRVVVANIIWRLPRSPETQRLRSHVGSITTGMPAVMETPEARRTRMLALADSIPDELLRGIPRHVVASRLMPSVTPLTNALPISVAACPPPSTKQGGGE